MREHCKWHLNINTIPRQPGAVAQRHVLTSDEACRHSWPLRSSQKQCRLPSWPILPPCSSKTASTLRPLGQLWTLVWPWQPPRQALGRHHGPLHPAPSPAHPGQAQPTIAVIIICCGYFCQRQLPSSPSLWLCGLHCFCDGHLKCQSLLN